MGFPIFSSDTVFFIKVDMSEENNKSYKPDWTPDKHGDEFAIRIVKGVEARPENPRHKSFKRKEYSTEELVRGVLESNRILLAKTITLIESTSQNHQLRAKEVLTQLLPHSGKSLRIGISGVPGAGKSTLIEALGVYLINLGHKVAVLTIDPSSSISKGSILGDKTRMEKLAKDENCFIRPSPSSGTLGGVARKTRESITACEAAGYDIILIETVGVGQSETTVRSMVDFFLLVLISGGGDELQGMKKGVMEICDAILINKADGENKKKALMAKAEYSSALHYLYPSTEGWESKAYTASAITGEGIEELWSEILKFMDITKSSGIFERRRRLQNIEWVEFMIKDYLFESFFGDKQISVQFMVMKEKLLNGEILPSAAFDLLKETYLKLK